MSSLALPFLAYLLPLTLQFVLAAVGALILRAPGLIRFARNPYWIDESLRRRGPAERDWSPRRPDWSFSDR